MYRRLCIDLFLRNKRSLGQEPLGIKGYTSGEALLWCTLEFVGIFGL